MKTLTKTQMRSLTDAIRTYMDRTGATQEELANLAGVSQPLISKICSGKFVSNRESTYHKIHQIVDPIYDLPEVTSTSNIHCLDFKINHGITISKKHLIFGDENAARDELLEDCYVSLQSLTANKKILVGRWGVGKTAILFHKNAILDEVLNHEKENYYPVWYIGENLIELDSLKDLKNQYQVDSERFKRFLEIIWWSEIVRKFTIIISKLSYYYGNPKAMHWSTVRNAGKTYDFNISIWDRLKAISPKYQTLGTIQNGIEKIFSIKLFQNIQACLKDIQNDKIQPRVVIEPDTPFSGIEKDEEIAQLFVNALLNAYFKYFSPSREQLAQVTLTITWQRWQPQQLDYPQRIVSYLSRIRWNRESLYEFINNRIEWEFRRVKRNFNGKKGDAWNALFEKNIINMHCDGRIKEDSFDYFLRHTHYRPRDLQRLVRVTVEKEAFTSKSDVDEVLMGRGNKKIRESIIRDGIQESLKNTVTYEFIPEVMRKFSDVNEFTDLLYGINVPFSIDDLKGRYKRKKNEEIRLSKLNEIILKMWEAGIIGVEVKPTSEGRVNELREILPKEAFRQDSVGNSKITRWYFFVYNWDGEPLVLLERYNYDSESEGRLVLHPITFNFLLPSLSRDYPIGI